MKVHYRDGSMERYISGYRLAAEHLSHRLVDVGPEQHELVYPVVFLYRHYIELQLKSIVNDGRILLCLGDGFPEHHRLRELWDLARQLMQRVVVKIHRSAGSYLSSQNMATISTAIADFEAIDPRALSFRYPALGNKIDCLDGGDFIEVEVLSQRMRNVSEKLTDLDLACVLLREYQDHVTRLHGSDA